MLSTADLNFGVLNKNINVDYRCFKHEISTRNVENVENTVKPKAVRQLIMWITWGNYVENVENNKNIIKMMIFSPCYTLINIFLTCLSIIELRIRFST